MVSFKSWEERGYALRSSGGTAAGTPVDVPRGRGRSLNGSGSGPRAATWPFAGTRPRPPPSGITGVKGIPPLGASSR